MKSLDIVDKLLEKINQYDDWFITEVEAEQIKQDLEVLEILRVRVFGEDEYSVSGKCIVVEDNFRDLCHIFFKEDEMKKVIKWLEENDE